MLKSLWPCMALHALQKVNVNITVLLHGVLDGIVSCSHWWMFGTERLCMHIYVWPIWPLIGS